MQQTVGILNGSWLKGTNLYTGLRSIMFKRFIKEVLDKDFHKQEPGYRTPASLVFDNALKFCNLISLFKLQLRSAGYKVNGGFIEK